MSDATYLANLRTRRDAVAAELAALSTSAAGGLPNTDGTGVNVDHTDYKRSLYEELERLELRIRDAENQAEAENGNLGIFHSQEFC